MSFVDEDDRDGASSRRWSIEVSRATVPERPILAGAVPACSPTTRRSSGSARTSRTSASGWSWSTSRRRSSAPTARRRRGSACSTRRSRRAAGSRRSSRPGMAGVTRREIDELTERAKRFGAKGLVHLAVEAGGERQGPDRQVPVATRRSAAIVERDRRRRGRPHPRSSPTRRRHRRRPRPAARRARRAARPGRSRTCCPTSGSTASRCTSGTPRTAAGTPPTTRSAASSPRTRRCSRPRPATRPTRRRTTRPAAPGRSSTTSRSTAGSSAAGRSGSTAATCSSAASCCRATRSRRCARSSARSSTPSSTARRRTAGSPSASTAGPRCSPSQTNIREVMAFPKTQSGTDLMLEAPSPPEPGAVRGARPALRRRPGPPGREPGGVTRANDPPIPAGDGDLPGPLELVRRAGRGSRRWSGRCASRSRASSTAARRSRPRPATFYRALFGLPLLVARRARRAAAPRPAAAAQPIRLAALAGRLLRRRPDVLAPRDRGGRGGAGDRPRQPPGHHRRRSSRGCSSGSGRRARRCSRCRSCSPASC